MIEENFQLLGPTSTAITAQLLHTNSEEHSPPSFILFSKLPPEPRIKIWRLSIQDNRVVGIKNVGLTIDPPDSIIDEDGRSAALAGGAWKLALPTLSPQYFTPIVNPELKA
jgi:hypothetical protein